MAQTPPRDASRPGPPPRLLPDLVDPDPPSASRRREASALIASAVVPGLGQLILGRPFVGLALFAAFSVAANAALLGRVLRTDEVVPTDLFVYGTPIALLVWVVAVVHAYAVGLAIDRVAARRRRRDLLREGLFHYVSGDWNVARERFRAATDASIDPDREEIDALFHLGVVLYRMGDAPGALRAFRTLGRRDFERKWADDVAALILGPKRARKAAA